MEKKDYRKELPIKKPDDPVPLWKIISKFIGQDLTKVSMPVVMNEPMSGMQKVADALLSIEEQLSIAANTDDSLKRLARTCGAIFSMTHFGNYRKKKPFNPMLGESYEMVTEKFRYLAEKT